MPKPTEKKLHETLLDIKIAELPDTTERVLRIPSATSLTH